MPEKKYIENLSRTTEAAALGNKARQLKYLMAQHFPIPETYVCAADLHRIYRSDRPRAEAILRAELENAYLDGQPFAVRSSANIEDGLDHSFAGQFESFLDVHGIDAVHEAVIQVWESATSSRVRQYLADNSLGDVDVAMSVLIQRMVDPKHSGVVFSRNPTTGLDEIIIEAVPGRGDLLVQHGVTPERWIYKWGDWIEKPEAPGLDQVALDDIVSGTRNIAKRFGRPVDLEWVYDGTQVYWVQLRGQTQKDEVNIYSNRISKEFMPGIIKPLLWSVSIPLVNTVWVNLFSELIGKNDIDPHSLAKSFYGRSYFNMGVIGSILESLGMERETLEIMLGIEGGTQRPSFRPGKGAIRHFPRMLRFAADKLTFARKVDAFLPSARERFDTLDRVRLDSLTDAQLVEHFERIYALTQETAYFNVVVPLLNQFYFARLRKKLEAFGIDYDRHNITGGPAELENYDPAPTLRRLNAIFRSLDKDLQEAIAAADYQALAGRTDAAEFKVAFDGFLARFGHLGESGNDFTAAAWGDNADLALKMVTDFPESGLTSGQLVFEDLPLTGKQRRALRGRVRKARQYRVYREAVGFLYTYGYSRFRKVFLELGNRLQARDILPAAPDIFYLTQDEVHRIVHGAEDIPAARLVAERKAELAQYTNVFLPSIIFGDQQPPLLDSRVRSSMLTGVPTSRGYYRGRVRVIRSLDAFDRLQPGEVLVIPYSDIGWTPIFSKAGAVIAESGGVLSHSSIVAREYGIPAVVSVNDACELADGTEVTVDGYKGQIFLHDQEST